MNFSDKCNQEDSTVLQSRIKNKISMSRSGNTISNVKQQYSNKIKQDDFFQTTIDQIQDSELQKNNFLQRRMNTEIRYLNNMPNGVLKSGKSNHRFVRKQQIFLFDSLPAKNFDLDELLNGKNCISSDQTYTALYKVLLKWNRLTSSLQTNRRAEFFRNQYIYQTLKNILFQPHDLAKKHLQNLYMWYKENSQQKQSSFNFGLNEVLNGIKKKHNKAIDEDNQIRNSYKSTLPFQIQQYHRKNFSAFSLAPLVENQQNLDNQFFSHKKRHQTNTKFIHRKISNKQRPENKLFSEQRQNKEYEQTQNTQFYHRNLQSKLLRRRELQDVQLDMLHSRQAKARLKEHTTKNFNKGFFKTSTLFFEKKNKSEQLPQKCSFLKTQEFFYRIKKTKIQSSSGFRSLFKKSSKNTENDQKITNKSLELSQVQCNNNEKIQDKQNENKQHCNNLISEDENSQAKNSNRTASIDGIGLIRNPFDAKLPKGNKNK